MEQVKYVSTLAQHLLWPSFAEHHPACSYTVCLPLEQVSRIIIKVQLQRQLLLLRPMLLHLVMCRALAYLGWSLYPQFVEVLGVGPTLPARPLLSESKIEDGHFLWHLLDAYEQFDTFIVAFAYPVCKLRAYGC